MMGRRAEQPSSFGAGRGEIRACRRGGAGTHAGMKRPKMKNPKIPVRTSVSWRGQQVPTKRGDLVIGLWLNKRVPGGVCDPPL